MEVTNDIKHATMNNLLCNMPQLPIISDIQYTGLDSGESVQLIDDRVSLFMEFFDDITVLDMLIIKVSSR